MFKAIAGLVLGWSLVIGLGPEVALSLPLQRVNATQEHNFGFDEQLWGNLSNPGDLQSLIDAVDQSLKYLATPKAAKDYRRYSGTAFSLDRVRRSLVRFRQLLVTANSPQQLQQAVESEFEFYQSVGKDNQGTVEFTGYFVPTYKASPVPTAEYRYPLYRRPANFDNWRKPHPTRAQLEGKDGLQGHKNVLAGYELVWLSDRLEAFLVQVQGSAKLQMTDGTQMSITYGGSTNYPYTSIGGELVKDGVFPKEELTLPRLLAHFEANPQALDTYIPRNNRFIFFYQTDDVPPNGSLSVPVTAERSIATDKSLMPPGALALIQAPIPQVSSRRTLETSSVTRYVLDQDTGSAIKGAGRVDIFLGSGELAGDRAGLLNGPGKLYYLLLKD
ncbi:MltA domain-containing protein [Xenococcus sp. PCC 7305]|uniref:murein transglycosylase A n=1 Tax=Xenococcus sp. PCC 7305 TaxID=102125 RepID=UPI0002DBD9B6